ncbi:MAG TPA: dCTP deaminase [Candidatus Binataceae bacterium]|nr:dCTP deaminase [Candidatus Binataceae bacterium]
MILPDFEIQKAIADGRLVIQPEPDVAAYDTNSVDLRLDGDFFVWDLQALKSAFGSTPEIDISSYDYAALSKAYLRPASLNADQGFSLRPREFVLGQTLETVHFPAVGRLAGRVERKSSLARLGLSVHFAPTVHCTFEGHIVLELYNAGDAPIKLKKGAFICQLLVEPLSHPPTGTMEGKQFQHQTTPHGAKSG